MNSLQKESLLNMPSFCLKFETKYKTEKAQFLKLIYQTKNHLDKYI